MHTCAKCGGTEPECVFNAGSTRTSYCRRCKTESKRRERAAKRRTSEHQYGVAEVPEGFRIKGITQLLGPDGKIKNQHVKTELEPTAKEDKRAAMLEALRQMCEPYKGSIDPALAPVEYEADLIKVLPIGDLHVGLQTHAIEVGEDWDMHKAERMFCGAVDGLFEAAPRTAEALIVNVGDYLHADNSSGTTTKGTPLDTSGPRFEVLLVALRMFRRCIDRALLTSERVTVICCTGNHDGESSVWLRLCLSLIYEREQRVYIHQEPRKYHHHQFGRCMFSAAHGDTCKSGDLPLIGAVDEPAMWAATEHRQWITGHIHHLTTKEHPGCVVRSYRSQAKTDKWHNWSGYRSERDLRLELWHREFGQVQEFVHSMRRTMGVAI